jgi:hypothetical protein
MNQTEGVAASSQILTMRGRPYLSINRFDESIPQLASGLVWPDSDSFRHGGSSVRQGGSSTFNLST